MNDTLAQVHKLETKNVNQIQQIEQVNQVPQTLPVTQVQQIPFETKKEEMQLSNDDSNIQKKKWSRQPINKKIKRNRRNRRLRKMLTPKNAYMSLHELMRDSLSDFTFLPDERGFIARVYINNIQYEGHGNCIFLVNFISNFTKFA